MQVSFSKFIQSLDSFNDKVILSQSRYLSVPINRTFTTTFKYRHDPKKTLDMDELITSFQEALMMYVPMDNNNTRLVNIKMETKLYKYSNLMKYSDPMEVKIFQYESPKMFRNDIQNETQVYRNTKDSIKKWIPDIIKQNDNVLFELNIMFNEF